MNKLIWMIENDKDPAVRGHACQTLGNLGDERALGVLERFTSDQTAAKDHKLYAACMEGLKWLWAGSLYFHSSAKAFDLFTRRLATDNCSEHAPPFGIMGRIESDLRNEEKLLKAAPWFPGKKKQLVQALGKVVGCKQANASARSGAIRLLRKLGADKALFAGPLEAYKGEEKKHEHVFVVKDLEEAAR